LSYRAWRFVIDGVWVTAPRAECSIERGGGVKPKPETVDG
jgi:hypothetical protein